MMRVIQSALMRLWAPTLWAPLILLLSHFFSTARPSSRQGECPPCGSSGPTSILVSVSYSGDNEGMQSLWETISHSAHCVHLYASEAAGFPHIPEDVAGKTLFVGMGGSSQGRVQGCGEGWKGYHIVMEDTILYPEGYVESIIAAIEAYNREVIVGYFGFVWIGELIPEDEASHGENMLPFPEAGGLAGALDSDTWVDVLSLGTLAFHMDVVNSAQARTGSHEDAWVGRFLPTRQEGFEDVGFAAAMHFAGIPRVVCYHAEGWLTSTHPTSQRALSVFPYPLEGNSPAHSNVRNRLAFQFSPWQTQFLNSVPNTFRVSRHADEQQGKRLIKFDLLDVEVGGEQWIGELGGLHCDDQAQRGEGPVDRQWEIEESEREGIEGKLTVVIPVYWRPRVAFLRRTVRDLAAMSLVDKIIIVYNNADWSMPKCFIDDAAARGKVFLVWGGGLNERFRPRELVRTKAVLSMDDEYAPTEMQLQRLFGVWKSFPDRIVGPMHLASRHVETIVRSNGAFGYKYGTGGWKGYYNLILTGFAIFHRGYMPIYFSAGGPAEHMRAHVHTGSNCEDIAMNFIVGEASEASPIAVDVGEVRGMESASGLSHLKAGMHYWGRTQCINLFTGILGRFPLVNSTGGQHRTAHHSFASVAAAEAEAQELGGEKAEHILECSWMKWSGGRGGGCGLERFGVLPRREACLERECIVKHQ